MNPRDIYIQDNNIDRLRERYPEGLHFVVGDTHGEWATLDTLMKKIKFDPAKDHVYLVGDYNEGGDPKRLLEYLAEHYQADYRLPGFHLIRGNHERELWPLYELKNLPDILVHRGKHLTYYIVHSGMVSDAFDLINGDMESHPGQTDYAYWLDESCAGYDAPFRQIIWSRRGLYSQRSQWHVWPSEQKLHAAHACIIHGHTPYSFMFKGAWYIYGDRNLFWRNQHVWFSEDLQSFNVDANVKGKEVEGQVTCRALACLCLEVCEELAARNGRLTVGAVRRGENGIFGVPYIPNGEYLSVGGRMPTGDLAIIETAQPKMKRIGKNRDGIPVVYEN